MYHSINSKGCKDGENCTWLHDHDSLQDCRHWKIREFKKNRQAELQIELDDRAEQQAEMSRILGGGYETPKLTYHKIRLPGFHLRTLGTKKKLDALEDSVQTDVKRQKISPTGTSSSGASSSTTPQFQWIIKLPGRGNWGTSPQFPRGGCGYIMTLNYIWRHIPTLTHIYLGIVWWPYANRRQGFNWAFT